MNEVNYTIFRGDTFSKTFVIKAKNLEITQMYFTMKAHLNDSKYTIRKSLNDGIEKISDNRYVLTLSPDDTDNLKANGTLYEYDVELIAGTFKRTVLRGTMRVESDVTRPNDVAIEDKLLKISTDDADAVAADILLGKTAYARGEKITGTLDLTNLIPENIREGISINGILGTYKAEVEEDSEGE